MKDATDFTFKGVSWSGGGRKIERVDVSMDGGESWTAAELYKPIEQTYNHHWAWTQFSKTLPIPDDVRKKLARGEKVDIDITSKALDSGFNVQPSVMAPYWNARGIAINHWYHVKVTLDPSLPKGRFCVIVGSFHCRVADDSREGEIVRRELEHDMPNTPSGGKFDRKWEL